MNNKPILIAIACGLLAAMLFIGQATLGGLGMILSSFTALPLFVSVLGFGTVAGIISGAVTALIVGFFFGPLGAAVIILFTLLPALWIGHMAGLSRDDSGVVEWFDVKTIMFRMALMCAAITVVMGYAIGYTVELGAQQVSELMTGFVAAQQQAGATSVMSADEVALRSAAIANLIPVGFPASLFLLMTINLLLAEKFARGRDWILRPKDKLAASVGLPPIAAAIFAAALVASFASGPIGLIAKVLVGAFGATFVAVGLATAHFVSRTWPARGFMLTLAYAALLFSMIMAPVLALLGIAETLFQLRARASSGPKSNLPTSKD